MECTLCCRVGRSGVLFRAQSRSGVAGLLPLRHPGSTGLPARRLGALPFNGTFEHTLDVKNRLTLPAKFRTELRDGMFLVRGEDPCLTIFPSAAYEAVIHEALSQFNP